MVKIQSMACLLTAIINQLSSINNVNNECQYGKHEATQNSHCEGYCSNIFTKSFLKVISKLRKLEDD